MKLCERADKNKKRPQVHWQWWRCGPRRLHPECPRPGGVDIFAPNVDVMKHTQRRNERINGGDQVMFSKVDECDEEGRTGLIHATLQGKVGLILYCKVNNYCVARSNIHFRYYKWCFVNQENMVEVLLDGSADIEVGFLFVVMRLCSWALIVIHLLNFIKSL